VENEEKIDSMLKEHMELTKQIDRIVMRMGASVAMLRHEIREATWSYEEELERLKKRRGGIRKALLSLWDDCFDRNTVILPSAKVIRRNFRGLVVHDKFALLDALDRAGRLDLVDYVFKENEVAKLIERGKLGGLNGKVEVKCNYKLSVSPIKEDPNEEENG
jgi:hypothetical protein